MIGGFLGAGKTTAVGRLAQRLTRLGRRVGLITNDQGRELVDTATLAAQGYATEEISGGCFCCRFNSLLEAARKLSRESRPDVFIAEPVGSCTDLVATVSYPLRRIYGEEFSIAPLSVLVDPVRALRVLGLESGGKFSEKVLYIYRKQLQEADYIVINKIDLVAGARLEELRAALTDTFPQAQLLQVCARTGEGLEDWFERLLRDDLESRPAMEIDYAIYGEGEALLGWLNATVALQAGQPFDGNLVLRRLAELLQQQLLLRDAEVAHLKMTLSPEEGLGEIAVINLVRNDHVPELGQELEDLCAAGQLIINLRAELAPEALLECVRAALLQLQTDFPVQAVLEHEENFRPGQPRPTHRFEQP